METNEPMMTTIADDMEGGNYDEEDLAIFEDDGVGSLGGGEDDISFSESEEEEDVEIPADGKISRKEQLRMLYLRRYLDQLSQKVKDKEYIVKKTREEQKKCRERVKQLEDERDVAFDHIQSATDEGNMSAVYRLRAQHERVCQELNNEQQLEVKISDTLDQAEYDYAKSVVEQGKYQLNDEELTAKEEQLQRERTQAAMVRNHKEQKFVQASQKQKKAKQKEQQLFKEEYERKQQHAVEEMMRSKEKANKHLSRTMKKIKQREAEEESRQKEHMERRISSMLRLKEDITVNRDNLKALQARDRAYTKKAKDQDEYQRHQIDSAGGNSIEEMIKCKRLEEFEKEKELFKMKQREKQIDIASKILAEEERMKKKKTQQPYLFPDPEKEKAKIVRPHPRPKLKTLGETDDFLLDDLDLKDTSGSIPGLDKIYPDDSEDEADKVENALSSQMVVNLPDSSDEEEEKVNLAKPEFEGLWDKHKPYKVPKDTDGSLRLPGASKMDKEIMQQVLQKHREGIVIKQVAGGKEFRGTAFYSKPDLIHFKDFDVGKTYKKKVTLTNVSYSVNYCKLTGLTEHLKDFIDIHFDPPGQMSAGLTCEMLVTFSPKINEDLDGEVRFLAQTGPFCIPIRCTTKKCDLSVDRSTIDFGTSVIGETLKRTITLKNNGAQGTKFDFYKVTGMKQRTLTTAETSLGRLTASDTMPTVSPDSEEIAAAKRERIELEKVVEKKEDKKPTEKTEDDKDKPPEEGDADKEGDEDGETLEETGAKDADMAVEIDAPSPQQGMGEMGDFEVEELASLDGMKTGKGSSGEIGPFSTLKLEIIWQPTIPGKVDTEFVINFSDPESENITCSAVASAIDVPVWVERQSVDLKICMLNRLYQDTIIVNNRATTALKLKFEVCKELRDHLELLPKTGYIQARSQFSAQLKFLPRKSLFEEAGRLFDPDTGVMEAPMIIRVANQTRPVPFTVQAVVTNSDMQFDQTDIDFGCCTIHESVKTTVKLSNNSILPQQFGFVGLPEYVEVQPDDGFGTLLPLETIELDIIFQPSKARDYNFELTCKSLINREFKIKCKGVGVHPPLELSKQVVHFKSTAVNDVATTALHVVNSHTSMNEFSHPVPRIGKGEIAPVGPTSFEFVVPEDAPLIVSPSVGTVEPGKKCRVQVRFKPCLSDREIRREAVRMIAKNMEARAAEEYRLQLEQEKERQEEALKNDKKKGTKGKPSPVKGKQKVESQTTVNVKGPTPVSVPEEATVEPKSDEYASAQASLLRQFKGRFQSFTIPCYVASGKCGNPGELSYSVHNTLYLDVHCPAVKPELVIISDNGRTTTDFGDISIGQDVVKSVTIQNISDKTIDLKSSVLDTSGPFQLLNALRMLPPDGSHTLLVSFTPHRGHVFQEVLEIFCCKSVLHVTLKGRGVSPMVNLSVDQALMDMGVVISEEYREDTFKIMNTSTLSIEYNIKLDSHSLRRHTKAQGLPCFIKRDTKVKTMVGSQNNNGQSVFDCVPAEGIIPAGGSKEITVTFSPDHQSDYYSDGVRIELFNQEESHVFRLVGQAKPHIMYLMGTAEDRQAAEVESLAVLPVHEIEDDSKPPPIPVLVTLYSVAKDTEFTLATKEITVGCVRTMAVSQKKPGKNGEWVFDNTNQLQQMGFNIEPAKGMLEAGTKRPITITWMPQAGYDPNKPLEASINCTLKGDVTESYRLLLRAFVMSE